MVDRQDRVLVVVWVGYSALQMVVKSGLQLALRKVV